MWKGIIRGFSKGIKEMKIKIQCEGLGLNGSHSVRKCAKCCERLEHGKNCVALKGKSMFATMASVHINCFKEWAKEVETYIE